jgi:DNA-binding PadR family transcriptional regulator
MTRPRPRRARPAAVTLTTPDLVLLSLLAERPMHGYEVNGILESRNIRDWAAVSRPQIYYSLDKLTTEGLIRRSRDEGSAAGPERRVYRTTRTGLARLSAALTAESWTTDRARPAFLTWLALSWQAPPGCFEQQAERRRAFLESTLTAERATLEDVLREVGHPYHEAVWMLKLTIAEIETELAWLAQLVADAAKRQPAGASPSS